jgi:hypothetical protein
MKDDCNETATARGLTTKFAKIVFGGAVTMSIGGVANPYTANPPAVAALRTAPVLCETGAELWLWCSVRRPASLSRSQRGCPGQACAISGQHARDSHDSSG